MLSQLPRNTSQKPCTFATRTRTSPFPLGHESTSPPLKAGWWQPGLQRAAAAVPTRTPALPQPLTVSRQPPALGTLQSPRWGAQLLGSRQWLTAWAQPAEAGWLQGIRSSLLSFNLGIRPMLKRAHATGCPCALLATQSAGSDRNLLGIHLGKPKLHCQTTGKPLLS